MQFLFKVGVNEQHLVKFDFYSLFGVTTILVDGKAIIRDFRLVPRSEDTYQFEVGKEENHKVRIHKLNQLPFAGLRKRKYKVYVDEQLIREFEGY